MSKAIVFFADGMEECEALLVVDLLRRGGCTVVTASVKDTTAIVSSHGIHLEADVIADDAPYALADMIILPGGVKGTENLSASSTVRKQCIAFAADKKVAAICAAPSILASLGLLEGRKATVHPGFESAMGGAILTREPVTVDGPFTTGRALGAAIPFALELVYQLEGPDKAKIIADAICWESA